MSLIGRGDFALNYERLKAGLDRLQSTTVATSIRQPTERRRHRFSWINEWKERADAAGRARGIELILPDWFYAGVIVDELVLTIDREYFSLTGGLERWLYRLVRKHGGRQQHGWSFDFRHLHLKSGSLSPYKRFAFELRDIVRRQPLPGYRLDCTAGAEHAPRLRFQRVAIQSLSAGHLRVPPSQHGGTSCESARPIRNPNTRPIGNRRPVLSGTQTRPKDWSALAESRA